MGEIHPGIPKELVLRLAREFDIRCFVKSGTHRAETACWAADHFERVITIELSGHFHAIAAGAIAGRCNIELLLGDSRQHLAKLAASLPPAIFWLDAHWGLGQTAGENQPCPLLDELAAIAPCWERAYVLADDARYFLAPPPAEYDARLWPSLAATVAALNRGSGRFVACFEDVFVSLPAPASATSQRYIHDVEMRNSLAFLGSQAAQKFSHGRVVPGQGPVPPLWWRAARSLRRALSGPAIALARAIGHLPVQFRLQDRAVGYLADRFNRPRRDFDVAFRGYRYAGWTGDLIDAQVFYFGAFERPVVTLMADLLRRLAKPPAKPVLYDIGGNTGHHSLFVAHDVRQIYAFEPYARVHDKFAERIRQNGLRHIDLFAFGLGDEDGEANYYAPVTLNQGSGSFVAGVSPYNSRTSIRLPIVRGDRLVEEKNLLPPDLIKIDVEGSERLVLAGLARTIQRHRPVIVGELSPGGRWLFGGEKGLRAVLYDDCVLLAVAKRAFSRDYRLERLDFDRSDQFLCVPRERAAELQLPRRLIG
jgi:FkbM family methyltransferase